MAFMGAAPRGARRAVVAIASTIFLAALGFALDFYGSVGQRLADVEQARLAVYAQESELRQADSLRGFVREAATTSEAAMRFYQDHLARIQDSDRLSADLLRSGATLAEEARFGIATAEGAIFGVFPHSLEPTRVALETNLVRVKTSLGLLTKFFSEYSTKGPSLAILQLRANDTWIGVESLETQLSWLRAWGSDELPLPDPDPSARAYQEAGRSFFIRLWTSVLAVAYCVLFISLLMPARLRFQTTLNQGTA